MYFNNSKLLLNSLKAFLVSLNTVWLIACIDMIKDHKIAGIFHKIDIMFSVASSLFVLYVTFGIFVMIKKIVKGEDKK